MARGDEGFGRHAAPPPNIPDADKNYRLNKTTKDEYIAMRALEEARKRGQAPAALDQDGKEINPHIPNYIVKAPWYALEREKKTVENITLMHQRGLKQGIKTASGKLETPIAIADGCEKIIAQKAATKYRKSACINCGAMGHQVKDCLDRPRARGARWTGKDIKPDSVIRTKPQDFEAKRDRWAGYDPEDYLDVIQTKLAEEQVRKKLCAREEGSESEEDPEDEDENETADMPGQTVDKTARMTVRNLRIREDRAKYLYNLDLSSAYYDPKTRSMRENPHPDKPIEEVEYAGDAALIYSGDGAGVIPKMQVYAWEEASRGKPLSLQANPTEVERSYRQATQQQAEAETRRKALLEARYGPQPSPPPFLEE